MARKPKLAVVRTTIRDVAREAGVALWTVSNALTGKSYVLDETRRLVQEVADRLGYRASPTAQALRTRRTRAIGVLVADVANPSYPHFIRGIEDVAIRERCILLLCNTDGNEARQIDQMRSLIDRQVDGMVLLSPHCESPQVRKLLDAGIPFVLVQRRSARFTDRGRPRSWALSQLDCGELDGSMPNCSARSQRSRIFTSGQQRHHEAAISYDAIGSEAQGA
ncbi:MAG: LacI family DNA-binding transcriptional regulator [Hyphomicrobiales bacterium]|nr:LacI family DNA-binding transcriptional regulator [Hyphomicrobiales bacterium]